jgi:hypothetical protein
MSDNDFSSNYHPRPYPQQWPVAELEARAGALVNEALATWPDGVKRVH